MRHTPLALMKSVESAPLQFIVFKTRSLAFGFCRFSVTTVSSSILQHLTNFSIFLTAVALEHQVNAERLFFRKQRPDYARHFVGTGDGSKLVGFTS